MVLLLFMPILVSFSPLVAAEDSCYKWFIRAKISKGKDCEMKCAMLDTDLGNFDCPTRCDEFCKEQDLTEKVIGTLLYYPFLTPVEKTLVKKYPREAIAVYKAKRAAETATERKFSRNDQGDESDAFRHFVWAGKKERA